MKARIAALTAWWAAIMQWWQGTRPGRTLQRYADGNGALLAQGLSYQSIFAAFAAIWVTFAITGFWLRADDPVQLAVIDTIAYAVPGLIDQGEGGAIQLDSLRSAQILGWTGAIAAIGLCWTVIGWFGSARNAVRVMVGLPARGSNPVLRKLGDAGLAITFAIAVVVSAFLSLLSTSLLGNAMAWAGIEATSTIAIVATRIAGLTVTYGFDFGMLCALFFVMARHARSPRTIAGGAAFGALAFGALKALGGVLLGGASANPLLASFAVIIGLLIWFNLIAQVLLLTAAWIGAAAAPRPPSA